MNISRKWLRDFVDITATDKEYDEIMTIAGQKVETVTRMDAEIKNVVVGKVLSMARHENSDHMWVCMVDVGSGEPVQIVTGAQNVHAGDLVPVAQHNSDLPGGIHITKGKLRGVESCGMLCSYKELGLTEHDCPEAYADGIWILNDEGCTGGQDINEVIGNNDAVVEFEITNNRPDCFSLIGLAREAAATFGALTDPPHSWMDFTNPDLSGDPGDYATPTPAPTPEGNFDISNGIGSKSDPAVIKKLQTLLSNLGWLDSGNITGKYDSATQQAVKDFQQYMNDTYAIAPKLTVDGKAGP